MKTQADALAFIARAIEAGAANADEFDLPAIADTLYNFAGGWDFDNVSMTTFWTIVVDNVIIARGDCPYCDGMGYRYNTPSRPSIRNTRPCGDCGGSGVY